MSLRKISTLTFGGSALNNPIPYDSTGYSNYWAPGSPLNSMTWQRRNVTTIHNSLGIVMEVTALIEIDSVSGLPKTGPDDSAYLPCPPFCEDTD